MTLSGRPGDGLRTRGASPWQTKKKGQPLLPFDAWTSDLPLREAVARHAPQGDHALLAPGQGFGQGHGGLRTDQRLG